MTLIEKLQPSYPGNNLYFEITSYPLRNVDGDVTHVIQLARDVSERRQAEEALKEKAAQSEHLAALARVYRLFVELFGFRAFSSWSFYR